jgi:hypothetical protein
MKTLVLLFIGMTSAFLAECCQGDRTQGQRSALKIAKSTVEVHSVWHDIYVATEWDRRVDVCCVLLCAPAQERPRKSEGTTSWCTNITTIIFPRISKAAMREPPNQEGFDVFTFFYIVGSEFLVQRRAPRHEKHFKQKCWLKQFLRRTWKSEATVEERKVCVSSSAFRTVSEIPYCSVKKFANLSNIVINTCQEKYVSFFLFFPWAKYAGL